MKIKPFKGIRPPQNLVEKVQSRPYDVLNSEEARAEAGDNEMSLYHIIKPEIDFPVGTDEHDPRVYEKAVENGVEMVQYAPHFDRRHNINLILTYTAGAKREWEFSGRWNFGTGFPFTQVQGFYEYYSFQDGINFDYTTTNGELGVLYGELNLGRLPTYHRFDIDVKRKFFFTENVNLEVDLSVTNVYNRNNVFYVNLVTSEISRQLPILPTVGMTLSF